MIIVEDRKPVLTSIQTLNKIAGLFMEISVLISRLEQAIIIVGFSECHFIEGTPADRKAVHKYIKEIQAKLNELNEIYLEFKNEDILTPYEQKQSALYKAEIAGQAIRRTMLGIWDMRNSGMTEADNKKIKELMIKMFSNINSVIKNIQEYTIKHNKTRARKLVFNVKWKPLPK